MEYKDTDKNSLVVRVLNGLGSNKYYENDYEKLYAFASDKKIAGAKSMLRVKKFNDISKQHKEQNLMSSHKYVWNCELSKLFTLKKQCQSELDEFMNKCIERDDLLFEINKFVEKNDQELIEFRHYTVDPIWNLREDILYWLGNKYQEFKSSPEVLMTEQCRVTKIIDDVKTQQKNVFQQLCSEQHNIEEQLNNDELQSMIGSSILDVNTGIPEEALTLECPSDALKISVLEEFINIDSKYVEKLHDIDNIQSDFDSYCTNWSTKERYEFSVIIDQYPYDLPERRKLYLELLQNYFLNKSKEDLISYEKYHSSLKHYESKLKSIISDWKRDRTELTNQVKLIFNELCVAHAVKISEQENHFEQRQICESLYSKVKQWREKKFEEIRQNQLLLEKEYFEMKKKIEIEQMKNNEKRNAKKKMIDRHNKGKLQMKRIEKEQREKEQSLRNEHLKKQASHNKERIGHRNNILRLRNKILEDKKMLEQYENAQREIRLEKIREQVRPIVEPDLLRLWQDTESWKNHQKKLEFDDENIQKPFFELNTYSSNQVTSDLRIEYETKLRNEGLLSNKYAQEILKKIEPPRPPRKGLTSNIFENMKE